MTDEQLAKAREYFERTYDGTKVIPIIDELIKRRHLMKWLAGDRDDTFCPDEGHCQFGCGDSIKCNDFS